MAPEELHQLPHAAGRGRLLRSRPDQDRRPAGRAVPARLPDGSVEVLQRGARPAAHAEPEPDAAARSTRSSRSWGGWGRSTPRAGRRGPSWSRARRFPGSERRRARRRRRPRTIRSRVGQALFRQSPPGCFACHSTAAGREPGGPVARRHRRHGGGPHHGADYHGKATDAAGLHPRVDPRARTPTSLTGADLLQQRRSR